MRVLAIGRAGSNPKAHQVASAETTVMVANEIGLARREREGAIRKPVVADKRSLQLGVIWKQP